MNKTYHLKPDFKNTITEDDLRWRVVSYEGSSTSTEEEIADNLTDEEGNALIEQLKKRRDEA
jgi:hypothetical protein